MSLRLFCDQCVPREVTELLRDAGHAVFVLRDHFPLRSLDPEVIAKAQRLKCLLVSLNGYFSDIITYPPADYGGIPCDTTPQPPRSHSGLAGAA